jgi:hypothetical protein
LLAAEAFVNAPRIEQLAGLMQAISNAAIRPSGIQTLVDALFENGDIFENVVVLRGGYGGAPFVVASAFECSAEEARGWMRWPLRRLFIDMKPSRIHEPFGDAGPALAIPFSYGIQRIVVIARLRWETRSAQHAAFFSALESITITTADVGTTLPEGIPETALEPEIVAFALEHPLHTQVGESLARRGWEFEHIDAFGKLTRRLRERPPDVLLVDGASLHDSVGAVARVHRIADYGPLRVLAFGSDAEMPLNSARLIDRVLSRDAGADTIFRAIKELALQSNALRRTFAAESDAGAARTAFATLSPQELADYAAERASQIMHGWAACILVNEYGAVFRAEFPNKGRPIFQSIPKTFVAGESVFESNVGDDFFEVVSDNFLEQQALMDLRPTSAAAIPLTVDGQTYGAIVACSQERRADSHFFESLHRFGTLVAARFQKLQPTRFALPELQKDRLWDRLRDRMLHLDVYRSQGCTIPWRYRIFKDAWGLLTLGIDDDAPIVSELETKSNKFTVPAPPSLRNFTARESCFAATIDFSTRSMRYASRGFSPPLAFERSGPNAVSRKVRGEESGVATLAGDGAVICDQRLWNWLRARGSSVESLTAVLDRETPVGLASLVTLD